MEKACVKCPVKNKLLKMLEEKSEIIEFQKKEIAKLRQTKIDFNPN